MSLLEEQLATLELLRAMYPLPSELALSPSTTSFVDEVDPTAPCPPTDPYCKSLEATLILAVDDDPHTQLEILIELSLYPAADKAVVRARQPSYLPRTTYKSLLSSVPPMGEDEGSSEYVLEAIRTLLSAASDILSDIRAAAAPTIDEKLREARRGGSLERVWFWFPSLSSKEKRRDLVTYAEDSRLTGFVLAGKPGLLCVEGDRREVDRYMARIKSESWSDIPPHQKKVTERLRRPLSDALDRKFTDMKDITDRIPHYGQYAHRGEMGEVRRLMEEWGVGEDFGAVVMNSGS